MKTFTRLVLTVLLAFTSQSLFADPIEDLSMKDYKAGWYPNFYKQKGPLTCAQTCKAWVGTEAEGEQSGDLTPNYPETDVCKITDNEKLVYYAQNDPKSHWLYGNQFVDKPVCYSATSYGEIMESQFYMCLCVDACDKPDLIVSHIYDPVWDGSTGQSIIKADITNVGSVGAASSYARIIDTVTMANDVALTPPLAPGATTTVTFYISGWVFDPDAELEVTADYKSDIDECDETNNVKNYFKQG